MAITTDDFNKIWASASPLTPYSFSKSQYKEGWNFIGSTPPSRQMWDFLQKNNDEKMQYLLNHFDNYLPLSGGTVTGLTVTGETSVPTANAGNSSKAIANTAYVQGELTNYLPLSGGTVTGGLTVKGTITGNVKASQTLIINDARTEDPSPGNCISEFPRRIKADFKSRAPDKTNWHAILSVIPWDNSTGGYPSQLSFTSGGKLFYRIGYDELTWGPWHQIAFRSDLASAAPTGAVQAFAGRTTPEGWLLCDGSAVSRTDYAALFAVIGTTYGTGNGSTTFNLPNLVDKFVEGSATAGTVKSAGLPNITGKLSKNGDTTGYFEIFEGAFVADNRSLRNSYIAAQNNYNLANGGTFDASRSNSIYGKSDTVQPPALTMRYIIKY